MMRAVFTTLAVAAIALAVSLSAEAAEPSDPPVLANPQPAEGPAQAYYRWIDSGGRIQYTDFEPIGVPSELIPLTPPDDDAPVLSGAEVGRAPDPFHDQDQQILPIEHIGPCAEARRQLAILHAALPVYLDEGGAYRTAWRGDSYRGSREYLDAESRTRAIAGARNAVLENCSDPEAFAREEAAFQDEIGRD
jgi:hypothetical protein